MRQGNESDVKMMMEWEEAKEREVKAIGLMK